MIYLHAGVAILHLVASLPLLLAVFCGYQYGCCREVSGKCIGLLILASVWSLVGLYHLPGLLSMKSSNVLLLAGSVATSVVGVAFWIRRFHSISLIYLISCLTITELAILAAVDHRFRIIVQNPDGVGVDVANGQMAIGHAWSSFGASGIMIHKRSKLAKGEYYFGLLVWLQSKEKWTFCGSFSDPDGNYLGNLEWKPAKWTEWPKHVVVNPNVRK